MGTTRSAVDWVWLAMVLGLIHAAFSLYWAAGGNWLLGTVGEWAVELRESDPGTVALGLAVIGLAKAAAAVVPVLVAYGRLPGARFWRAVSWVGAVFLILYGGVNTVVSNAVLAGWAGDGNYKREAMIGHAWLWDPLFLLWGVALLVYLWRSRRPRNTEA